MSFRVNTNVTAMNALNNLSRTGAEFSKSITRLSTGLRINSAADDPAGLITSENFRAQITGLDQAVRNSQDAINFAKTAEGALDEVNRLLRDARGLAVAAGNTGTLSASQIQANQSQLSSIVDSITRIANNTQFGTKKLLDGSSGVVANVSNANIASITLGGTLGGSTGGTISTSGAVGVNVTTAATRATDLQTRTIAVASTAIAATTAVTNSGSFAINGQNFNVEVGETWGSVVAKINNAASTTGVQADLVLNAANDVRVNLTATKYGSTGKIAVSDSNGVIRSAAGANTTQTGVDAVATVTVGSLTATFTGGLNGADGLTLADALGNKVSLLSPTATNYAAAGTVTVGSAAFQIGGNANQTTSLSVGNFTAANLSISSLNLSTAAGATTALTAIDAAIDTVTKARGDIGSFQRNVLESNIRSLSTAKENLAATESTIRDTDIANEMTNYTKLQILQQSGLSVLSQANQSPQSVLSLLR